MNFDEMTVKELREAAKERGIDLTRKDQEGGNSGGHPDGGAEDRGRG